MPEDGVPLPVVHIDLLHAAQHQLKFSFVKVLQDFKKFQFFGKKPRQTSTQVTVHQSAARFQEILVVCEKGQTKQNLLEFLFVKVLQDYRKFGLLRKKSNIN